MLSPFIGNSQKRPSLKNAIRGHEHDDPKLGNDDRQENENTEIKKSSKPYSDPVKWKINVFH